MLRGRCLQEVSGNFDFRLRHTSTHLCPFARRADGLFHVQTGKGTTVANHLTPDELSKELGIERTEVIRVCLEEGVPIYQGKIDKTLFQAQLQANGVAAAPAS
jgi:hypothetical protein